MKRVNVITINTDASHDPKTGAGGLREFSSKLLNSMKETRPPDVVKIFNEDGEQVK